jgi:hypothetical protein
MAQKGPGSGSPHAVPDHEKRPFQFEESESTQVGRCPEGMALAGRIARTRSGLRWGGRRGHQQIVPSDRSAGVEDAIDQE